MMFLQKLDEVCIKALFIEGYRFLKVREYKCFQISIFCPWTQPSKVQKYNMKFHKVGNVF